MTNQNNLQYLSVVILEYLFFYPAPTPNLSIENLYNFFLSSFVGDHIVLVARLLRCFLENSTKVSFQQGTESIQYVYYFLSVQQHKNVDSDEGGGLLHTLQT